MKMLRSIEIQNVLELTINHLRMVASIMASA